MCMHFNAPSKPVPALQGRLVAFAVLKVPRSDLRIHARIVVLHISAIASKGHALLAITEAIILLWVL